MKVNGWNGREESLSDLRWETEVTLGDQWFDFLSEADTAPGFRVSLFGKTFREEAVDQTVRDFWQNGQEEPVSVQLVCGKNIPNYPNGLTEDPHSVLLLPLFHAGTNSMCHIHSPPCVISHAAWWCGHLPWDYGESLAWCSRWEEHSSFCLQHKLQLHFWEVGTPIARATLPHLPNLKQSSCMHPSVLLDLFALEKCTDFFLRKKKKKKTEIHGNAKAVLKSCCFIILIWI